MLPDHPFHRTAILGTLSVIALASTSIRAADDAKPDKAPPATTRPARPGPAGGLRDPSQLLKFQRERLNQLDLTADQKKKLDEIYSSTEADFKKALDEAKSDAPQERRQKVAPILISLREKV